MKREVRKSFSNGRFILFHRVPEIILLISFLLLFFYLLFQITLLGYGRDQGIYAVVARTILDGGAPYRDAWDFKPPGIYFIYALSTILFGDILHAVRIFEALCFLSLAGAFIIYIRSHFMSWQAGIIAATLAALAHVQLDFWDTGQPESFGGILIMWALVCITYRPAPNMPLINFRRTLAWGGCGLLFSLAGLLKPFLAGGLLTSLAYVAWKTATASGEKGKARTLRYLLGAIVIGAALPLFVCGIYLLQKHALQDFYETFFVFAPRYASISFSAAKLPERFFYTIVLWLPEFSILSFAGILFALLLPLRHSQEREGFIHAGGALLFPAVGIVLQGKMFPYHFGALIPGISLLAGWGIWKVWTGSRIKWIVLLALAVLLYWQMEHNGVNKQNADRLKVFMNSEPCARDKISSKHDVDALVNRQTSEWLLQNTPQSSPIYIWGFEPIIYILTNRPCASRYIYNVPQRAVWSKEQARKTLINELTEHPPSAIIVAHNDRLAWVTGSELDSAEELGRFTELSALLKTHYLHAVSFGKLDIYRQKPTKYSSKKPSLLQVQGLFNNY